MNITEVSEILFKEISQDFGQGEKREISYQGSKDIVYDLVELNPKVAGFNGAIGFRRFSSPFGNSNTFLLWSSIPKGESSMFEPDPILRIRSGPKYAGQWVYGQGMLLKESCLAKVGTLYDGINLLSPGSLLTVLILRRCLELISEASSPKQFYQVEKNPSLQYTRP